MEFRYKRECLKELGVEDPYLLLDQLPGLWAYSTLQWLRHTIPTDDSNRGTLGVLAVLAGDPAGGLLRQWDASRARTQARRRSATDLSDALRLLDTAAAYLAGQLPADEDGTHFLLWFMTWQEEYLRKKRVSFGAIRDFKQTQLGVVPDAVAA